MLTQEDYLVFSLNLICIDIRIKMYDETKHKNSLSSDWSWARLHRRPSPTPPFTLSDLYFFGTFNILETCPSPVARSPPPRSILDPSLVSEGLIQCCRVVFTEWDKCRVVYNGWHTCQLAVIGYQDWRSESATTARNNDKHVFLGKSSTKKIVDDSPFCSHWYPCLFLIFICGF